MTEQGKTPKTMILGAEDVATVTTYSTAGDSQNLLLKAALGYAAEGWPVFPLQPGKKTPATRHGLKDATTDPEQIESWWQASPNANIGMCTGHGLDVIDLDSPKAIDWMQTLHLPRCGLQRTARKGGAHVFIPSTGHKNATNLGGITGLDYRGLGGYVVMTPSFFAGDADHNYQGNYQIMEKIDPHGHDPAPWLEVLDNLKAQERANTPNSYQLQPLAQPTGTNPAYVQAVLQGCLDTIRSATTGERNHTLNTEALKVLNYVAGGHLDEVDTKRQLTDAALSTGLEPSEISDTIESAWSKAGEQPKDPPQATPGDVLPIPAEADPEQEWLPFELEAYWRMKARVSAQARITAETAQAGDSVDYASVAEHLSRPAPPPARIAGLMPWEASTLIVAQRKTGKTTLTGNLARSLLTGEPFLGAHKVIPLTGNLAILNYEVSGATLAAWLQEIGVPTERVFVANMRGRSNPLKHPKDREQFAQLLRNTRIETLIVDPFGRAYTGTSQNDTGEVSSWLGDLDQFARTEVGAKDLILTAHAGWGDEGRVRGASALEDWPDSIWRITKDPATDTRYIRADGRDIALEEDELAFDPATRTLTLTGFGGKKNAAAARRQAADWETIRRLLERLPEGLSGKDLALAAGRKDGEFTAARNAMVEAGELVRTGRTGRGSGFRYSLPNLTNS